MTIDCTYPGCFGDGMISVWRCNNTLRTFQSTAIPCPKCNGLGSHLRPINPEEVVQIRFRADKDGNILELEENTLWLEGYRAFSKFSGLIISSGEHNRAAG